MRRMGLLLVLAVALLAFAPTFSAAQSRLFDGASLSGRIAPESPSAEYNFDASRGDVIAIRVLGINGLDPVVTVQGPDGNDFITGFDDPWSPEPGDSLLTFNAPEGGAYTVVLQAEGGSGGDFVLQFNQQPPPPTGILPGGQAIPVPVSAAAGPLHLQFASIADCPTTIVISPGAPAPRAIVNLRDARGVWFAQLDAGSEQRVTVEEDSGLYVAEIVPLPGSSDGQLVLTVACATEQPACTAPPVAVDAQPSPTPAGLLMTQPGGELVSGSSLQGEIGQASPQLGYTFEGTAGQPIALQVTGVSFAFQPTLSLLGPTLAQVGSGQNSTGGFRAGDAVLRAVLPEDGRYTALVGSVDQAPGAFLIRLAEDPASAPSPLAAGSPVTIDEAALAGDDGWFQRYTFTALDTCPTALDVQTSEGFPLATGLVVRKTSGELVGQFAASPMTGATLLVPAGSGDYEVLVPRYGDLDEFGTLTMSVSCQSDSPACSAGGSPQLISTPTPGTAPAQPTVTLATNASELIGVVSVASANVRRGDGPEFSVIHALPQGTQVAVVGISNNGSGWFKVRLDDGAEGWMSPQVLTVGGDLSSLPRVQPPARPIVPTSVPVAPTSAPSDGGNSGGNGGGNSGGGGQPAPVCGNGTCESGETCSSCAADCGSANPDDACANYCLCQNGSSASVSDCGICESDVCGMGNMDFCSQPLAR